jgi:flagellar protein FliL
MAGKGEEPKDAKKGAEAPAEEGAKGGGIKAFLPLILNIVLMPAIAFGLTQFVLLPKLKGATGGGKAAEHGEKGQGDGKGQDAKAKFSAPLSNKILVNVSGTMGTRYLLANITLVSAHAHIKELADKHDAQLRDAAATALSTKTINDLEKPTARNVIRAELITLFNNILGPNSVSEIYLTEFAIQ